MSKTLGTESHAHTIIRGASQFGGKKTLEVDTIGNAHMIDGGRAL
jgi:hypothetical protein